MPVTLGSRSALRESAHALRAPRPKLPLVHLLESRDLRIALSPLFSANGGSVNGYEALCQFAERLQPAGPMDLLEAASVAGLARELDLLLVDLAISRFGELDLAGHLFINLLPQTLVESRPLLGLIAQSATSAGVRTSDLVIEITEHGENLDPHVLRAKRRRSSQGWAAKWPSTTWARKHRDSRSGRCCVRTT